MLNKFARKRVDSIPQLKANPSTKTQQIWKLWFVSSHSVELSLVVTKRLPPTEMAFLLG